MVNIMNLFCMFPKRWQKKLNRRGKEAGPIEACVIPGNLVLLQWFFVFQSSWKEKRGTTLAFLLPSPLSAYYPTPALLSPPLSSSSALYCLAPPLRCFLFFARFLSRLLSILSSTLLFCLSDTLVHSSTPLLPSSFPSSPFFLYCLTMSFTYHIFFLRFLPFLVQQFAHNLIFSLILLYHPSSLCPSSLPSSSSALLQLLVFLHSLFLSRSVAHFFHDYYPLLFLFTSHPLFSILLFGPTLLPNSVFYSASLSPFSLSLLPVHHFVQYLFFLYLFFCTSPLIFFLLLFIFPLLPNSVLYSVSSRSRFSLLSSCSPFRFAYSSIPTLLFFPLPPLFILLCLTPSLPYPLFFPRFLSLPRSAYYPLPYFFFMYTLA